jgi:hypothetical protein
MLNNQNWDKPKTNDIHSLDSLIAWLETKDPQKSYDYASTHRCMCAQYYKAKGYWLVVMWRTMFYHGLFDSTTLPKHFNEIAECTPRTFGAALKRARQYQMLEHFIPAV